MTQKMQFQPLIRNQEKNHKKTRKKKIEIEITEFFSKFSSFFEGQKTGPKNFDFFEYLTNCFSDCFIEKITLKIVYIGFEMTKIGPVNPRKKISTFCTELKINSVHFEQN